LQGAVRIKINDQSQSPSAETETSPEISASPTLDPKSISGKLTMWHFNKEEAPNIEKSFEAAYKGIDLKVTVISDRDQQYINKLTSAIRSGSGVPDIFTGESAFVKRLVEMPGAWADITERAETVSGDMAPYTVQLEQIQKV
jgi:ABC-type glycerol-3-phosphate transport system substrate-binding protein